MTENERVKFLRETLKKKQDEFGRSIGLSQSAITKIEKGKAKVTDQTKLLLIHNFGVTMDWLNYGTKDNLILNSHIEDSANWIDKNKWSKVTRLLMVYERFGVESDNSLSNALGYSTNTISGFFSGRMPDDLGEKLHENFGISKMWFETGYGSMFSKADNSVHDETQKTYSQSDDIDNIQSILKENILIKNENIALKKLVDLQEKHIAILEEKCAPNQAASQ